MANPKNVTITLTAKQRSELKRLTGTEHNEVRFESVTPQAGAPRTGVSVSAPRAGLNVAKPRAGLNVAKPRAGLNVAKPRAGLNVAKPRAGLNVAKPRTIVGKVD